MLSHQTYDQLSHSSKYIAVLPHPLVNTCFQQSGWPYKSLLIRLYTQPHIHVYPGWDLSELVQLGFHLHLSFIQQPMPLTILHHGVITPKLLGMHQTFLGYNCQHLHL